MGRGQAKGCAQVGRRGRGPGRGVDHRRDRRKALGGVVGCAVPATCTVSGGARNTAEGSICSRNEVGAQKRVILKGK